jgi:prepilin-type cleavage/methylation N-terminal domain protein
MIQEETKKGFTIMELMLAMGVIAFLLLSVAGLIIQMTNTITRGTTYKDLNAASRTINADLTKTFNSTSILDGWDGRNNSNEYYRVVGGSGAFCTGSVSYLWNTNLERSGALIVHAEDNNPVRFVKIRDTAKNYCSNNAQSTVWTKVPHDDTVTEILSNSEVNLQLHSISFSSGGNLINRPSNQMIINIAYVLGTPNNNDIRMNAGSRNCEGNVKSNYCAVNKFELTVRTLGR